MDGRKNTWWVEYCWKCQILDNEGKWFEDEDFDSGRFQCTKKQISTEVRKAVENALQYETYKDLEIKITDKYITTESEF